MKGTEVRVRNVSNVGPDTVALVIESPSGFNASPGQFVQIGDTVGGEKIVRHYSVSSPYNRNSFEVTVRVDPGGDLTPKLASMEEGDKLEVAGPFGRKYYEGEKEVVVLAGGPGVGPAVGIGERAADEGGKVGIVYKDDKPSHEARLKRLVERGGVIKITEDCDFDDFKDSVSEVLNKIPGQMFVYGFRNFVEKAIRAIEESDKKPGEAKIERFD